MEIKSEEYKDYLEEQYLSMHEAADFMEVDQEELLVLVKKHEIPSHNIAGAFTRLKKQDLENLKNKWRIERELFPKTEAHFSHHRTVSKSTLIERILDFWYYNDFYIICGSLILALLYFIVSSQ